MKNNEEKEIIDKSRIIYRYSTEDDAEEIQRITYTYYGRNEDVVNWLKDRYLLAVYEGSIIALSGVNYAKAYRALEMDYTYTAEKYEDQGIMTLIFEKLLSGIREKVYCNCWKIGYKEECNLFHLMQHFGFRKVIPCMETAVNGYNCFVESDDECTFFTDEGRCYCTEELWLREAPEHHCLSEKQKSI